MRKTILAIAALAIASGLSGCASQQYETVSYGGRTATYAMPADITAADQAQLRHIYLNALIEADLDDTATR